MEKDSYERRADELSGRRWEPILGNILKINGKRKKQAVNPFPPSVPIW